MKDYAQQLSLFDDNPNEVSTPEATPAGIWEQVAAKRALDELFSLTVTAQATNKLTEF
jgi:hypothetical protein